MGKSLATQFLDMLPEGCPQPEVGFRFHPTRRWAFDYAWPDLMVAVEIQGGQWAHGRHSRGAGMAADYEKFNAAAILGWKVLLLCASLVKPEYVQQLISEVLDND